MANGRVDDSGDNLRLGRPDEGFRGSQVCSLVGITYRRIGLLGPHRSAPTLDHRCHRQRESAPLLVWRRPRAQGDQASTRCRSEIAAGAPSGGVPSRGPRRRPGLLPTGAGRSRSVLAQSDGEVVDLLAGGQGVFNVLPLSGVVSKLEAGIVEIRKAGPSETGQGHPAANYLASKEAAEQ